MGFVQDVYPSDEIIIRGGIKCRPPAYYDKMYAKMFPEKFLEIQNKRTKEAKLHFGENTPARLAAKEVYKTRQFNLLVRPIERE